MDSGTVMEQRLPGTCGARTKSGTPCKRQRGWGTDHKGYGQCRRHGGNTPDGIKGAARERMEAEGGNMAMGRRVEPIDALLHVVYATAGRVEWLGRQVAAIEAGDMLVDSPRGMELAAYAKFHGLELDRLARVSKMALDAGVAERRVQMAERTGALIGAAFEDALAEVGTDVLPAEIRALIVRRFVGSLAVIEQGVAADEVPGLPSAG